MTSDTIYLVNDIIDSYVTNPLYDEMGQNLVAENYDHLVFSVMNYQGSSIGAFENTVDAIVESIESHGIRVFDVRVDSGGAVIETAKN